MSGELALNGSNLQFANIKYKYGTCKYDIYNIRVKVYLLCQSERHGKLYQGHDSIQIHQRLLAL
jgi:hypothetical protein